MPLSSGFSDWEMAQLRERLDMTQYQSLEPSWQKERTNPPSSFPLTPTLMPWRAHMHVHTQIMPVIMATNLETKTDKTFLDDSTHRCLCLSDEEFFYTPIVIQKRVQGSWAVLAHAFNPSTWEAEAGRSL